jgi:large subunit ribosomal protein L15
VAQLNCFEAGTVVDIISLLELGLVKTGQNFVKILGDGEIDRPLTVKADKFTATAKSKIEAAGGTVEEVVYEASAD